MCFTWDTEYDKIGGINMDAFERNIDYDLDYALCVYFGISKAIDYEINYGEENKIEVYEYIVDRYCNEIMVSGKYLKEKLEEYKSKYKKKD